jgi:hypothetical protein
VIFRYVCTFAVWIPALAASRRNHVVGMFALRTTPAPLLLHESPFLEFAAVPGALAPGDRPDARASLEDPT